MKEVKVPILPESISEATVAAWHKKPGDYVEIDDVIVEIETDKVVLEVPAEESGVLSEILEKEGETVSENQVLGLLDDKAKEVEVEAPAEEIVAEIPTQETPAEEVVEEVPIQEAPAEEVVEEVEVEEAQNIASDDSSNLNEAPVMSNRMEERVPMSRIRKTIANRLHSATQNTAMLTTFNEVDMSEILTMRSSYKEAFEKKYSIKLF